MSLFKAIRNLVTYTSSLSALLGEMFPLLKEYKGLTEILATCLVLMLICLTLFILLRMPSAISQLMSVLSTATASSAG